jgi:hypothetical protein
MARNIHMNIKQAEARHRCLRLQSSLFERLRLGRRITVQGQSRKIIPETPPLSKITREKWTGGVDQAVEHLFCECEALSSNPIPIKRKNKRAKQKLGLRQCFLLG